MLGWCPSSCTENKIAEKQDLNSRTLSKTLQILHQKDILIHWKSMLVKFIEVEEKGLNIYEYKLRELFYIFRQFYRKSEIEVFLSSFHCRNRGFRSFVYHHHLACQSVEELAQLMGFSLSKFKRIFKEEFGVSPLQWMNQEKAAYIYRDLKKKEYSMIEMSKKYHFSSISYFTAFCKKMFQEVPSKIRDEK